MVLVARVAPVGIVFALGWKFEIFNITLRGRSGVGFFVGACIENDASVGRACIGWRRSLDASVELDEHIRAATSKQHRDQQ